MLWAALMATSLPALATGYPRAQATLWAAPVVSLRWAAIGLREAQVTLLAASRSSAARSVLATDLPGAQVTPLSAPALGVREAQATLEPAWATGLRRAQATWPAWQPTLPLPARVRPVTSAYWFCRRPTAVC